MEKNTRIGSPFKCSLSFQQFSGGRLDEVRTVPGRRRASGDLWRKWSCWRVLAGSFRVVMKTVISSFREQLVGANYGEGKLLRTFMFSAREERVRVADEDAFERPSVMGRQYPRLRARPERTSHGGYESSLTQPSGLFKMNLAPVLYNIPYTSRAIQRELHSTAQRTTEFSF